MERIPEIPSNAERVESINGQAAARKQTTAAPADLLLRAVHERWDVYKRRRDQCARGNIAAVHEFRVSIRRLIAAVDFLLDLVPDADAANVRKKLKKQLSRLSAIRDTQVQRAALEKFLPEHPGIAPLIEKLRRAEKRKGKDVAAIAAKPKQVTVRRMLAQLEKQFNVEFGSAISPEGALLRALEKSSVDAAFRRVISRRDAMRRTKLSTIHKTRLAFKRFRYLIELLRPMLDDVSDRTLAESRKVQTCMGTIHDIEVLQDTLNGYDWKGRTGVTDSMRVRRILQARRRGAIDELMALAKDIDTLWSVPEKGGE
ncbi:MAG TPA: CHAD domain-containing protein [Candidatus Kapabacteria bacterium]|nr:CHAD domain-containing protein [Candidatus Kapabacteria bacterium]